MDSLRPDLLDELARIFARAAVDAFLAQDGGAGNAPAPSIISESPVESVSNADAPRAPE